MHAAIADPILDVCLNPEAVRPLLQQALPRDASHSVVIDGVRVLSARRSASRYRNPNPLTLRYEADVHDDATGAAGTLQWYGKVYRGGASAQARRDTPALHLPQLDMLLWPWPADPGLPQLARLLDPDQTRRWWGEPAHTVSALRYEPEQRATLCYARNGSDAQARHLYVKTFCDDSGAALHRRFSHFWHVAQQNPDAPAVAQPLGYCPDTRALWQAQARGVPFRQALASAAAARLPQRLAQAIAAVHAAPRALAGPQPHDTAHWLGELRRRSKKITRAAPDMAARMARLVEALEQTAVLMPPPLLTVIHGDYHADQVWLDGARVVLFDFDEFTLGDAMEDLAAFVTRLAPWTGDASFATPFLAAYKRMAPARYCPLRLQWHLVVQQVLQVSRAFVFQVPGWRQQLERRLARAEALCAPATLGELP